MTALLRYISHTRKLILLKYTIKWFLVYLQNYKIWNLEKKKTLKIM